MGLELRHRRHELVVGVPVDGLEVGQGHGVADAGDDVLALRVLQVVPVHALRAATRVTGERDAGPGVRPQVAEHHRADVDGGAGLARDPLATAVDDGPLGVPRVEDRVDGEVHLLARVHREAPAGLLLHDRLETVDDVPEVLGVEVQVEVGALLLLDLVEGVLEKLAVDAEHRLAEHLDQPAVGVPGEPVVARLLGQALDRLVVEADVEDGLHHPGHRRGRTRPDRHEERVGGVPQPLAHGLLEGAQVLGDLFVEVRRRRPVLQVVAAGIGGDREAGRNGQPEVGHLGQVGALAPQQVLQVLVALAEVVDPLAGRSAGHLWHLRARRPLCRRTEMVPYRGIPACPRRPRLPGDLDSAERRARGGPRLIPGRRLGAEHHRPTDRRAGPRGG